eukprot:jgi/Galph1/401/GphlegSOOS_G5264.1
MEGKEERPTFHFISLAKSSWIHWHEKSGLPWWATLVTGAALIRLATFPLNLYNQFHSDKLAAVAPELERIRNFAKSTPGSTLQKIGTFRRLKRDLLKRAGTSTVQSFPYGKILHVPLFVTAAISARRLAFEKQTGFESEGLYWFSDLTSPDPTYILPLINSACLLTNTERSLKASEGHVTASSKKSAFELLTSSLRDPRVVDWSKIILQGSTILIFPLVSQLPSSVVFFWLTNTFLNAVQHFILLGKGRVLVGLPNRQAMLARYRGLADALLGEVQTSVEDAKMQLYRIQKLMSEYSKEPVSIVQMIQSIVQQLLENEKKTRRLTLPLLAEIR